jgi:hypothetical protein
MDEGEVLMKRVTEVLVVAVALLMTACGAAPDEAPVPLEESSAEQHSPKSELTEALPCKEGAFCRENNQCNTGTCFQNKCRCGTDPR